MSRIHVVINPRAASAAAGRLWPRIRRELVRRGFEVTSYHTERPRHAWTIARQITEQGAGLIACVGGDGTVNEVLNGLLEVRGPKTITPELAIIPVGTGSDLVKTLRIPTNHRESIGLLTHGGTKTIDVGRIELRNGSKVWRRYFANVSDVGLGGNVARVVNSWAKDLGGFFAFLCGSLIGLASFKPLRLKIYVDDRLVEDGLMTIVGTSNGQYFGGGMHIAPMAKLNDGVLDLLYVKDTNRFKFIERVLLPVYQAGHLAYRHVYHHPARRVRIVSDRVIPVELDGEEEKAEEVRIAVVPNAIRIRVPWEDRDRGPRGERGGEGHGY